MFTEIVYELGMLPLIERGYLADMRAIRVRIAADWGSLKVRHGDVSEGEAGRMFVDANGPGHVALALTKHAAARKSLIFTPTVAAAFATADAVNAAGIPAAAVCGETPEDERRAILGKLHRGELMAVANAMVLTEGFDEPSVDCVVVARPTVNRALYQQMVGRGSRIFPGKADCLVLDCVGATQRHDLVSLASLFGLPLASLVEEGMTLAGAIRERRDAGDVIVDEATGKVVAEPAGLFGARRANWVAGERGRWVLSAGDASLVILPLDVAGDRWRVVAKPRDQQPVELGRDLPLGYAQGLAEDEARKLGAGNLIKRDAGWRAMPASERQIAALQKWGISVPVEITRGEASDLISARSARWVR